LAGSLAEVARRAGVSVATASRALNGSRHPVSDEIRERIALAAAEVGYAPSAIAQALVTRKSRIIGVIVGDIVDPYFAEITRGAEDVARRAGYLTIVCNTDRAPATELAYLRLLHDYRAEGVIFAGGGQVAAGAGSASAAQPSEGAQLSEAVESVRADGIRVVSLAARSFDSMRVTVDDRAASYDITSYVCSLGHRRVCYVTGPPGLSTSAARLAGFQAAMADAGLSADEVHPGEFDFLSGQQVALRLVGRPLPDAVICANDESAIGVLTTLRQAGVDIPGEVSVAGLDDTRVSRFVDLTTVSVPMYERGAIAARHILDAGPSAAGDLVLPHRLVPRGTTARRRSSGSKRQRRETPLTAATEAR